MSNPNRYRVVLDTNVILDAGSRWVMSDPPVPLPENSLSLLVHRVAIGHDGLFCLDILHEYAEKLEDLHHPAVRIERYLRYLTQCFKFVYIEKFYCDPRPEDQDDTIFILCALNGKAHLLISSDPHLLKIRSAYDPPQICTPTEACVPLAV
ncbi:MAG: PIN domain-containing protein [Ktedonobacteraceae bacterium]